MSVIVYHNPRCSKSRETLTLLTNKGIAFTTKCYLDEVPTAAEIKKLIQQLGFSSARELMRSKEAIYKEQNLAKVDDEEKLIAAMVAFPKLIERPIVVRGGMAKLGRPPEAVLGLFDV